MGNQVRLSTLLRQRANVRFPKLEAPLSIAKNKTRAQGCLQFVKFLKSNYVLTRPEGMKKPEKTATRHEVLSMTSLEFCSENSLPHKCIVIGQSNSIIQDGFVDHLKNSGKVELIKMARIGASPSLICPYFIREGFFQKSKFAIFDLMVIDQTYLWRGIGEMYSISKWLEYAIHRCKSEGCIPIFLMIPPKTIVPSIENPVRQILPAFYRAIAFDNGCPFLDMLDGLHELRMKSPEAFEAAYRDGNHPSAHISSSIANAIIAFMDQAIENQKSTRTISVAFYFSGTSH